MNHYCHYYWGYHRQGCFVKHRANFSFSRSLFPSMLRRMPTTWRFRYIHAIHKNTTPSQPSSIAGQPQFDFCTGMPSACRIAGLTSVSLSDCDLVVSLASGTDGQTISLASNHTDRQSHRQTSNRKSCKRSRRQHESHKPTTWITQTVTKATWTTDRITQGTRITVAQACNLDHTITLKDDWMSQLE